MGLSLSLRTGLAPGSSGFPDWLLPQVAGNGIQYELTRDQYWLGSGLTARANVLSDTRNSDALFDNTAGVYSTFAANVPAITDRGLYPGGERTNLFLNNTAPVTQTITLSATGNYTLSVHGSGSVAVAANTATITGAGTASDGTDIVINCTATGTVNCTVTGSPDYVQLEKGSFASPPIVTEGAAATRLADSIVNPNYAAHAAAFGFASGMAALARVNLTRLSDGATRRIVSLGNTTDGAYIEFTSTNTFRAILRKGGVDVVTLTSGTVGATGVYDVTAQFKAGAYGLWVTDPNGDPVDVFGPELFDASSGVSVSTGIVQSGTSNDFTLTAAGVNNSGIIKDTGLTAYAGLPLLTSFEVYDYVSGVVAIRSQGVNLTDRNTNGIFTQAITGLGSGDFFGVEVRSTSTLKIRNLSVRQITNTLASAETLPAAIASAAYIGQKEDVTLHTESPLERLAMWGV